MAFGKLLLALFLTYSPFVGAAEVANPAAKLDPANTAWMITASVLVLFMTLPGLALFYGGLVRAKNVLSVLMQCFAITCMVTLAWVIAGYSLAFGDGGTLNAWYGGWDKSFLAGIAVATVKGSIPETVFAMFQMTFAIITPALVIGAYAERVRFSGMLLFSLLWLLLVYCPVAHWVWGDGWLQKMGLMDFAGGTVVHLNAGMAALVCAVVLGPRRGFPDTAMPPHNLAMTVTGASMLWVGWFGFNAGSALTSGALAASAFTATHLAAATATVTWCLAEYLGRGKASVLGAASGAVAGLVAITPASGFVGPIAAIIIGGAVGFICYWAVSLKHSFGYDDSLDAFGVHGVGGTFGALATGVFASKAINDAGGNGLLYGNASQLVTQLIGVVATAAYSFVVTLVILKIVDAMVGLRVTEDDEITGLDLSQHGEVGYNL